MNATEHRKYAFSIDITGKCLKRDNDDDEGKKRRRRRQWFIKMVGEKSLQLF